MMLVPIDAACPDLRQTMLVFLTAARIYTAECSNARHSISVRPICVR